MAASYHAEIRAPRDLVIDTAQLIAISEGGPIEHRWQVLDQRRHVQVAHLYAQRQLPRPVVLYLGFRMKRPGLLTGVILGSWFALLMMWFGLLVRLAGSTQRGDSAAAMVLVIPGLFTTYLFRPGEHQMARNIYRLVRWSMIVISMASFGAAGVLVVTSNVHFTRAMMWILLTIAVSIANVPPMAALLASYYSVLLYRRNPDIVVKA